MRSLSDGAKSTRTASASGPRSTGPHARRRSTRRADAVAAVASCRCRREGRTSGGVQPSSASQIQPLVRGEVPPIHGVTDLRTGHGIERAFVRSALSVLEPLDLRGATLVERVQIGDRSLELADAPVESGALVSFRSSARTCPDRRGSFRERPAFASLSHTPAREPSAAGCPPGQRSSPRRRGRHEPEAEARRKSGRS